jgi:hypothetical protein
MSSDNSSLGYSIDDINFEEQHNFVFDNPKEIKDKKKKSNIKNSNIFEWVSLNEKWKQKILSDNFLVYDSVDEETLNIENVIVNSKLVKPKFIKMQIKKYLNDIPFQEFSKIINNYKNEKNEFIGDFDINKIKTRNSLIKILTKPNFKLQTDNTTLHILSQILNLDFIIFDDLTKKIIHPKKLHKNIILMFKQKKQESYSNSESENNNSELESEAESESENNSELESGAENEFYNNIVKINKYNVKLIGLKLNEEIKLKFERNKLPDDLDNILDRHTFLLKHTQNAINIIKLNNKKLTIKEIMKEINNNIQMKLLEDDINDLMIILKNLLQQELFKNSINK